MDLQNILQYLQITIMLHLVTCDSLPQEEATLESATIQCPKGKEMKWKKTEPSGNDILVYYSCGNDGEQMRKLRCQSGYKAQYRRFFIPRPSKREVEGQEPNFGIFDSGNDLNTLSKATVVFACLKA